ARDQDLAGTRGGPDAGADVHGHAGHVVTADLALSGVQSRADLEAQSTHRIGDVGRAADAAGRPVERGQEAVAGRLDLAALVAAEVAPHEVVVQLEGTAHSARTQPR